MRSLRDFLISLRAWQLSFPAKVTAILITIVLISLGYAVGDYLGHGQVTVTVDKPNGYMVMQGQQYKLPLTTWLRAGIKHIRVGATGYVDQEETIRVAPLRVARTYPFKLTEKQFYTGANDAENRAQVAIKYPWVKLLPYQNQDFEIDFPTANGVFPVTLAPQALVIPGIDEVTLTNVLKDAKKKMFDWIRKQGTDPSTLKFDWQPYDPG